MTQFTANEVHERERFEEWYTTHARNYSRDPIGSRDCSLQWESWKAALAAHSAHSDTERLADQHDDAFQQAVQEARRLPIEVSGRADALRTF